MYQMTALKNNLRIVSHDMKDRDSVALGLLVGAGGRYENDQNKGAAHFLEHILFKGTQKYSCEEIKILIEGVGGSLNAFTSEESTCYFAKIPSKHVSRTFDILADMVFAPLISKKDVDKERTVILEEIKMYHDLPQYFVLELLDELIWPNHPLGKSLAGTIDSIGAMSHEDLRRFHRDFYSPSNIVVASCGNIDHSHFVKMVQKKLNQFKGINHLEFQKAGDNQTKPQVKFFKKETEQMHLAIGTQGLPLEHQDKFALSLLNIILGGNMSSRLFDEVREKKGLAYSISSSTKFLKDTGLFMVRAGVDNQKIVAAIEIILKELQKICRRGVTEDEFTRAKDYFLGQVLLGLEDTLDHMLWIGESLISLDRLRTQKDLVAQVQKVKIGDLQRVANDILKPSRFNLALVGPISKEQETDIRKILKVDP